MIIQTVNFSRFRDAFQAVRPDNFNYDGQKALYEYLENLSDDMGEPVELNVIAICCDWQQMTLDEIKEQYNIPEDEDASEWLAYRTTVIPVSDGSFIIGAF